MVCRFNGTLQEDNTISLEDQSCPKIQKFKYLGLIVQDSELRDSYKQNSKGMD